MEIYALVGKSGSGKSYKSHIVAGANDIEFVIDDGILIKGTKLIAGISAKREKTKFGAVRRAIFKNDQHRNEVKAALRQHKPSRLLVIGTSEHMIQSILEALSLGEDYRLVRIEDISTKEEIETAFHTRRTKGKHVIPVPTFEVKKAFSGYFIDSVRHWARKGEGRGASAQLEEIHVSEATVVRPTFSYLGSYDIKDGAIKAIVSEAALEPRGGNGGVLRVNAVSLKNEREGIQILITVTLNCKDSIPTAVSRMAERIRLNVEHMTGMNVLQINTIVKAFLP